MSISSTAIGRVKCLRMTAALMFGLMSSASAQDGKVLATVTLSSETPYDMFGSGYEIKDFTWQVNKCPVSKAGPRKIRKNEGWIREYEAPDRAVLKAKADVKGKKKNDVLQIAYGKTLGSARMVSKGSLTVSGRSFTVRDIVLQKTASPAAKPRYMLIKSDNRVCITQQDRPQNVIPHAEWIHLALN